VQATETSDPEAEWTAAARPWWRKLKVSPHWSRTLKAPSRPLWIGALVAMLSAGLGWTAGAKPWKAQRTSSSIAAAKASPNQQRKAPSKAAAPRAAQAAVAPRRVAVKSAPAAAAAQPTGGGPTADVPTVSTNGKTCPVAGPVSFIDSWGYPRSGGRTHEGVDMMADYGTPVVAIVSGSITYAGYGSSAGNWLILSGSDGNSYWYMHNQQNLVNGGAVSAGQQIATVGDTGNAVGIPHLHFEFHPGGGGPVNPYPLVASIC